MSVFGLRFDQANGGYLVLTITVLQVIFLAAYGFIIGERQALASTDLQLLEFKGPAQSDNADAVNNPIWELPGQLLEEKKLLLREMNRQQVKQEDYLPRPEGLEADQLLITACPAGQNLVALTFDDGPFAGWTEKYLKVLAEYDVKATFFVVGQMAVRHPEALKEIVADGHELGTHSVFHDRLTGLSPEDLVKDLQASKIIIEAIVKQKPVLFRPPYGAYNQTLIEEAGKVGQFTVLWNIDPKDWTKPDRKQLIGRIVNNAQDGSIVVLHEGKKTTLEALPDIIKELKEQGFEFATVSQLREVQV